MDEGISGRIFALAERSLDEWESGGRGLDALVDSLRSEFPAGRPAIASLLFSYFRRKAFIDKLIESHATSGKIKQPLRRILALAATQALTQTGIAPESAVNIAVDFAGENYGRGAAGFVNAVLRGIMRARPDVPAYSGLPEQLQRRWRKSFGALKAKEAVEALAINPPLSFRVRGAVDESLLASIACGKPKLPDWASRFDFRECSEPEALFKTGLFERGIVYAQDPATAYAVSLAADAGRVKGRILDLCAAPGGKTLMLSDVAGDAAVIIAADRSPERLALAAENFRRAGRRIETRVADAVEPPFPKESFDLVFADVPCSNTGVARRRPDAPWRFSINVLEKLEKLQRRILLASADLVAPGGAIVYSTCSVEPDEGLMQVEFLLAKRPEFRLEKSGMHLPCLAHDGAFAALIVRR